MFAFTGCRFSHFALKKLLSKETSSLSNMIGQSKISSFFKLASSKRSLSTDDDDKEDERTAKKVKGDSGVTTPEKLSSPLPKPSSPTTSPGTGLPGSPPRTPGGVSGDGAQVAPPTPTTPLNSEQRIIMAERQLRAKLKLTTRNTHGLVKDFGVTWFKALQAEFTKPYFLKLSKFVADTRQKCTVYPPPEQVFTFTQACDIKQVTVVILGQDPYHGPGQAHGLSFSVQKGIKCPPSLENMYKEVGTDIDGFKHPGHGNLTGWAEQGVLMLNACLTVTSHKANSHAGQGWEQFTDSVIAWFNTNREGIVFILWGAYAQKKGAQINKKKHLVLKGVHPSPLSAHRGFFGSKPFSQGNAYLVKNSKKPIDWTRLPEC